VSHNVAVLEHWVSHNMEHRVMAVLEHRVIHNMAWPRDVLKFALADSNSMEQHPRSSWTDSRSLAPRDVHIGKQSGVGQRGQCGTGVYAG
jgi:hypothetical protein